MRSLLDSDYDQEQKIRFAIKFTTDTEEKIGKHVRTFCYGLYGKRCMLE